tara:strand:+ start:2166 stop:3512 length:1347 start_codon:yes stop_codon:yes gene_type:complete
MITMKINSRLRLCGLPEDIIKQVREELTIDNPLYAEAQEKGRLTRGIPKQLRLMKRNRDKNYYSMPRGYYYRMCELIKNHKVQIYNETVVAKLIDVSFKGKLRRDQTRGGMLINENTCGVLKAPTGGGKTVIAIWTIAKRKVPTLIVVHTKELMYQWKEKLHQFLNINSDQVGLVGDGHRNFKDITIGIVNSLAKMEIPDKYGTLIVDECHRVPATTFANVVEKMSTRYLLGLTATDRRSDGLDELIYRYMGGLVHEIKTKNLQESGDILKPEVKIIETDYSYYMTNPRQRNAMIQDMINNADRNAIITKNIEGQVKEFPNGIALVISDRVGHCKKLQDRLQDSVLLVGNVPNSERRMVIEKLQQGISNILIATGQLIGEGFDLPQLSSVFLTTPIKFDGKLQQIIGRIVRIAEGKEKAIIYDFSDNNWLLQHNLKSRMEFYKKEGIL